MGCGCGKSNNDVVKSAAARARLSVTELGPNDVTKTLTKDEDDRSMLVYLCKMNVSDFAQTELKKRVSAIGTQTDVEMNKVESFSAKRMSIEGHRTDEVAGGIGYACKKGKKPESPNQDSFVILNCDPEFAIYGVFDGHGHHGHHVSNFVKEHLPKLLCSCSFPEKDPGEVMIGAFEQVQRLVIQATEMGSINATRSGTTATCIYHDLKSNTMWVAHVGDSRCVLARADGENAKNRKAVDLTEDHKPNDPKERARIEKAGGEVVFDGGWNYRVYSTNGERGPGLNMSRALGDLSGHFNAGISSSPDVYTHTMDVTDVSKAKTAVSKRHALDEATTPVEDVPVPDRGGRQGSKTSNASSTSVHSISLMPSDKFILLCSDGVWEFMSSQEAVTLVSAYPEERAMEAAEHLAQDSWDRWNKEMDGLVVDDITVVLIYLPQGRPGEAIAVGDKANSDNPAAPKEVMPAEHSEEKRKEPNLS